MPSLEPAPTPDDPLRERAAKLQLHGVLAHWDELQSFSGLARLIEWEEEERQRRSLERRVRNARLGRFKLMADFDWKWPKSVDRDQIEDVLSLQFIEDGGNIVILGSSGVGKTMLAQNIAHQAVLRGHSARFVGASQMLNDLASQESAAGLARRLRTLQSPDILAIDEVGYLAYDSRHADLLFEVVSRRHHLGRSMIITTNRAFAEWQDVFPNASCVVALVDRLVNRAELVRIDGKSYRLKEAQEREAQRAAERKARAAAKKKPRAAS